MRNRIIALLFAAALTAQAAEIFVDYRQGKSANAGTREAPLATFVQALNKAKPGDTIRILPSAEPIRDTIAVRGKVATKEQPITVDGMNNIFIGTLVADPKDWKEISSGLFCCKRPYSSNYASRYFMVIGGKIQRMGRFTKANGGARYKKPDQLKPGEWTLVKGEPYGKKDSRWFIYEFYVRLPEGKTTLADAGVEESHYSRPSGVLLNRDTAYLHFKNIIVKHFINDGYNIHDNAVGIKFDNIAAIECGDDGVSTHEAGDVTVNNFVSIRNCTAICHIQHANCRHTNVYAEGTLGRDIYLLADTRNLLENVWIKGDSVGGFCIANKKGEDQTLTMNNVTLSNRNPKAKFEFPIKGELHCTAKNVRIAGYGNPTLKAGITEVDQSALDAEIDAARKRFFALFNGQLEKALGE